MYFVINLKKYRKIRGLTQRELAEKVGVTQQYIASIEKINRTKSPTLDVIAKLSIALRVCPYYLINFNCQEDGNIMHCNSYRREHCNSF